MASVIKPRGRDKYQARFRDPDGERRQVPAFRDKKVSYEYARKLEEDAARLKAGEPLKWPDVTGEVLGQAPRRALGWAEAKDAYLAELARLGRSKSHLDNTRSALDMIGAATGWRRLSDVRAEAVGDYLRKMNEAGRAPGTQNEHRAKLRAFLNWCVEDGRLSRNPLGRKGAVRVGRTGRRRLRRPLTEAELARLLAAGDDTRAGGRRRRCPRGLVYRVAAFSGFRRVELRRLVRGDCTPAGPRPRWHVPAERTKNGQPVELPMSPECAAALAEHWRRLPGPEAPLFAAVPDRTTYQRDLKAAGVAYRDERGRYADFHALRYTFCSLLAKQYPIELVSKLMRHSSIQVTADVYLELGLDRRGEGEWVLAPLLGARRGNARGSAEGSAEGSAA